ncbi:hypothetical protein Hanom_Chr04g00327931 [Helianthus anomalus]
MIQPTANSNPRSDFRDYRKLIHQNNHPLINIYLQNTTHHNKLNSIDLKSIKQPTP